MAEPRKPVLTTAGIPMELARVLEPVKQCLEMLTGVRSNVREIRGLPKDATKEDIIEKINAIARRLNASGDC